MDNGFAEGYAVGQGNANNFGGGFGYGAGWDWIWIIVLFAFWGNGGWGFGGNGGNGFDAAVQRGFDTNGIMNKLEGINSGLCDGFYAMNSSLLTGFGNTQTAIMQNGYETRGAISDLGYRLQDCCCQTQRAIDGVNYNMAKNTCDITNAINNSTQQILGFMTQEKISSLQNENALLTAQLSQNSQTRTIIDALQPVAKPAYLTCSPYESSYGFGYGRNGYGYGNNCGCGCGCGCNG